MMHLNLHYWWNVLNGIGSELTDHIKYKNINIPIIKREHSCENMIYTII